MKKKSIFKASFEESLNLLDDSVSGEFCRKNLSSAQVNEKYRGALKSYVWMTVWSELFSDVLFDVEGHKVVKIGDTENASKELPNNQQDVQVVEDGIEVTYQGEKVFDVTNNKKFTITITNVDYKPAHFKARVVDR